MKKYGMPWKTVLSMGLKGITDSIWRLVVLIFLASVAFGCLGTAALVALMDQSQIRIDSLFYYAKEYAVETEDSTFVSEDDVSALERLTSRSFSPCMYGTFTQSFTNFIGADLIPDDKRELCMLSTPDTICAADEAFVTGSGFSLVGRLPEEETEVALSACMFYSFLYAGYYDEINYPIEFIDGDFVRADEGVYPVASAEQFVSAGYKIMLVNPRSPKEVIEATIVGVVMYDDCETEHAATNGFDRRNKRNGYDMLYVSPSYLSQYAARVYGEGAAGEYVISPVGSDIKTEAAFIRLIDDTPEFSFECDVTSQLESSAEQIESMSGIFFFVGLGATAFTALMVYQFISYSLEKRKQEIGILRALGAGKRDVYKIFLQESLFLALIYAVTGSVVSFFLSQYINSVIVSQYELYIYVLHYNWRIPLITLFASGVISLLSAFFPIRKTAKKAPVDAIRQNEI